MISLMIKL